MRRAWTSALLFTALTLSSPARGGGSALEQAKTLFNAGAQAYETGNYNAALQAFEEAYRIEARPGILFSIAQAHRRQYYVDKKPVHLHGAIKHYRDYLAKVEQGGRRADASQALAELEPMAERLAAADQQAARAAAPEIKPATRLMVTSPTKGVMVSVDGAKPSATPLIAEIKPGKHTLRLSSEGHFNEVREIDVSEGAVSALDIPLRERPGMLSIEESGGAQIAIDGRFTATTPLLRPLEIEPGHHLVTVTKNGYRVFSREIEIGPDERKTLAPKLRMTGQRVTSFVFFGVGVAALATGGALAGLALHQQSTAQGIYEQIQTSSIDCRATTSGGTCAAVSTYTNALQARDDLRAASITMLAGGLALGSTGFMLYLFDQPSLGATTLPASEGKPKPLAPPSRDSPIEMMTAPLVAPGLYGVAWSGRF